MTGNFPKRNNLLARSYPFPIGRVRKSLHLRDTRLETPTPRNSLSLQENYHFPFPRDSLKTRTAIDAFFIKERRYFFLRLLALAFTLVFLRGRTLSHIH